MQSELSVTQCSSKIRKFTIIATNHSTLRLTRKIQSIPPKPLHRRLTLHLLPLPILHLLILPRHLRAILLTLLRKLRTRIPIPSRINRLPASRFLLAPGVELRKGILIPCRINGGYGRHSRFGSGCGWSVGRGEIERNVGVKGAGEAAVVLGLDVLMLHVCPASWLMGRVGGAGRCAAHPDGVRGCPGGVACRLLWWKTVGIY